MQFVTSDELVRMEEQRRAEENRIKGDQESGRQRALQMMMGGRLEDR
jgi:hypothetical protein